MTDSPMVQFIF